MSERRRFERHNIQVPVNVSAGVRRDRVGVIRDVSASGMLFHSISQFAPGERIVVYFKHNHQRGTTAGYVVRAELDQKTDSMFRFLTAVRFDAPLLDLELAG